jgi:hypothetical protein
LTLMTLTGTLAPVQPARTLPANAPEHDNQKPEKPETVGIGSNVRKASGLQVISFAVAILLTIIYVPLATLGSNQHKPNLAAHAPAGRTNHQSNLRELRIGGKEELSGIASGSQAGFSQSEWENCRMLQTSRYAFFEPVGSTSHQQPVRCRSDLKSARRCRHKLQHDAVSNARVVRVP